VCIDTGDTNPSLTRTLANTALMLHMQHVPLTAPPVIA